MGVMGRNGGGQAWLNHVACTDGKCVQTVGILHLSTFTSVIDLCLAASSSSKMPSARFEPSSIKNKIKREDIARKQKKQKSQEKLQRRLALAKVEADDPLAKKVRTIQTAFVTWPLTLSQETERTKRPTHPRQHTRVRPLLPHRPAVLLP